MSCPPLAFWEGLGFGLMMFLGLIGWGVGRYFCARANAITKEASDG